MQVHDRLFIGGDWVRPAGTGTIDVVSPHTEQVIGRVPDATARDMDRAVAAAREAFDDGPWPRMDPVDRAAVVLRLTEIYQRHLDDLGSLITAQMGAPISQPAQTAAAAVTWRCFGELGTGFPWEQTRRGMFGPVVVRREPVGVVAAIVPWNGPQVTAAGKLAPALVAGCTVVLKPAPETPLDAYLLAELLREGVDKIAFTGSTAAGRRIGGICGERLKRHTLELGGKSAAILCDDAELGSTMAALKFAALANNGQVCVAQTRILAPRARYGEVVEALADTVAGMAVGDPADHRTEIGPLVSRRQRDRVEGYVALGQREGAKLVTGGNGRPHERGWYVEPAVFAEVSNTMRIAREEIFGPVLTVIPYQDEDDAVRIANDSEYGLAGSVWTADPERGMDIARRVRAGTYGVNTYTVEPCAPFGGYKASGVGRELGPEGLSAYLEHKSVVRAGG